MELETEENERTKQIWEIHERGALHLLQYIPNKSIDLIMTDLPYGNTKNTWDTNIDPAQLWRQYKRIIKDTGTAILFGQGMFTAKMMQSNVEMWKYNLVWDKVLSTGHLNANTHPMRNHEDIMIFHGKNPTYNPQKTRGRRNHTRKAAGSTNNNYSNFDNVDNSGELGVMKHPTSILRFPKPHPSISTHPTQKPVKLIEYLVRTYSNEGDTVHDSCLGSGATLKACMDSNRNCIGFEISDEWESNYKKLLRANDAKLNNWI
jgi:site-specific DNA-methyltransferase (adenine-specific)